MCSDLVDVCCMALGCTVQHVMCYSDQHKFVVVDHESSRVVEDVRYLVDAGCAVSENCDWAWQLGWLPVQLY